MSAPQTTLPPGPDSARGTASATAEASPIPASAIDASLRWPLLGLFTCSVGWLLLGLVLALIAAIKMHKGDFLADCPWLTVGRVRPAAMNAVLYGFASQAGLGISLWLLCRLGNVRFAGQVAAIVGAHLWNFGVLVGTVAVLAGASSGFEWLEMPRYAAGILFVGYLALGVAALRVFQTRRVRTLYPSQWFIFAALFWFPWLYTAANYLLVIEPVRGTLQSVVSAWYVGGLSHLWLGMVGLAVVYYFVPKFSGQPLFSSYLAALAFWVVLVFGSWAGMAALQGAPVPRWVPSVGVAATLCLVTALAGNAYNWGKTSCPLALMKKSPEAGFISLSLVSYLAAGVVDLTLACPEYQTKLSLTLVGAGSKAVFVYGFVGSAVLGAMYYILPRLLQVNWTNESGIRLHFGLHAAGTALLLVGYGIGGISQGAKVANAAIPFVSIAKGTAPFVGLATLGVFFMLVGHGLFAVNVVRLVRGYFEPLARGFCAEYCGCVMTEKSGKAGVKA